MGASSRRARLAGFGLRLTRYGCGPDGDDRHRDHRVNKQNAEHLADRSACFGVGGLELSQLKIGEEILGFGGWCSMRVRHLVGLENALSKWFENDGGREYGETPEACRGSSAGFEGRELRTRLSVRITASNAWLTRLPSRLTTRPRTPDLPAKLMKPLTSLTATRPPGWSQVMRASFT